MNRKHLYTLIALFFSCILLANDPPSGDLLPSNDSVYKRVYIDLKYDSLENDDFIGQIIDRSNFWRDSLLKSRQTSISSNQVYFPAFENDSVIKSRLKVLSESRGVKMKFTPEVKRMISVYGLQNKKLMKQLIIRSEYYFPIFEEYLNKYNLPPELKYVAAVESGLNPNAVSKSNAIGLWQFLYGSAKMFDLEINYWIDQRRDVYLSTDAACRYFEYLFRIYQDWELVLAAYNGGPGAVRKAIAYSGGKGDFTSIKNYLSRETQNYIPSFVAMNYVLEYASDFGIQINESERTVYNADTITVYDEIRFADLASTLSIGVEELKFYNPVYLRGFIPSSKKGHVLVLPKPDIVKYIKQYNQAICCVYNFNKNALSVMSNYKTITVKQGDSFHKVAIENRTTIAEILSLNNIERSYPLVVGQKLKVPIGE